MTTSRKVPTGLWIVVGVTVLPWLILIAVFSARILFLMYGWGGFLLISALASLVPLGIWTAVMYNSLVRARNHCTAAWSDVEAELKRRYELIPNLVTVVKGYVEYEREVLEQVTIARNAAVASQGSPASQAKDENALVGALRHLLVVVEGYPDLKASQAFLRLQKELADTEDRIQGARRFYNGNVRDYSNRMQAFPSNLVARLFEFKQREFFEIEAAVEREVPVVKM